MGMNKDKPAFPVTGFETRHGQGMQAVYHSGLSLRDYFAAKALPITYQYWMTDYYHPDAADADIRADDERGSLVEIMNLMADYAYKIADAMLKAREE